MPGDLCLVDDPPADWLADGSAALDALGEADAPADAFGPGEPRRRRRCLPTFVDANAVEDGPVLARWAGRLPLTGLALLEGPPGCAKSTVAAAIAAAVTLGTGLPGDPGPHPPGRVLWCALDEGRARAKRKLVAAGSDMAKVGLLDPCGAALRLDDAGGLGALFAEHDPRLLVLDTLKDHMVGDDAEEKEVRGQLRRVNALAEQHGVLVLALRHWRKAAGAAIDRGAGSIAYSGCAVAVLCVTNQAGRRLLAVTKFRDDERGKALAFAVVNGPRIVWGTECSDVDADSLAAEVPSLPDSKVARASEALKRALALGPRPAADVKAEIAAAVQCSPRSVEEASRSLGIAVERSGFGKAVSWRLPDGKGPLSMGCETAGMDAVRATDGLRSISQPAATAKMGQASPDDASDAISQARSVSDGGQAEP